VDGRAASPALVGGEQQRPTFGGGDAHCSREFVAVVEPRVGCHPDGTVGSRDRLTLSRPPETPVREDDVWRGLDDAGAASWASRPRKRLEQVGIDWRTVERDNSEDSAQRTVPLW
jgi:hypothetical protein